MKTPARLSSLHNELQPLDGSWREINGMPALVTRPHNATVATQLRIADVSCLTRFGVKGAGAAAWLENQGISVPDRPNCWKPLAEGGLIARLGLTEFLLEDGLASENALRLTVVCKQPPAKVYPVLRQDAAIAICGVATNELLRQTCNINFQALTLAEHPVILTTMVGVTVTIIPDERNGQPFYRVWCDGTFGAYLWRTLGAIVAELGGGVVGVEEGMRDEG